MNSYYFDRSYRRFNKPLSADQLVSIGRKNFSEHTMKKVQWVRRMYNDWRLFRNSEPRLQDVSCDIDDISTITEELFIYDVCRFITEVKKLDGNDFPAKTLYDIIICLQFWLETQGFFLEVVE